MATQTPPPIRARPYTRATPSPRSGNRRLAFRLLGLPVVAFAGVYLYNGLQNYLVLPKCDSERAKQSLAEVLKQLKLEPARYEPIKTISSSKDEIVCNAVMPLPDGGNVAVDYTFYWQGNKANMKYSIARKAS
jgi:hypothetical protein